MMSVGTIWMGMERGYLLGYGLHGYGNCDLSRDRSHPIPMEIPREKYRGNIPERSLDNFFWGGAPFFSQITPVLPIRT